MTEGCRLLNLVAVIFPSVIPWKKGFKQLYAQGDFCLGRNYFRPFLSFMHRPPTLAYARSEARYIAGEAEAFEVLTQVTRSAKTLIRSTRFFPDSVLTQPAYVTAMEQRVSGTDGKPPLRHYYRIVALNNQQKQQDINHHLNAFLGKTFNLYLTSNENAFELVIVDDTDAFIHFYKEEKIIDSTLHIQGVTVVSQFVEIFNRLRERELIAEFNCEKITQENLIEYLAQVDKIFKAKFSETTSEK